MWLVFVLFILLLFLLIIRIGLFFSKIKISIKHIEITENKFELDARASLYIFYKIKVLTIVCNENNIKAGKYKKIINTIDKEELVKKIFKLIRFEAIKKMNFIVEKININCQLGTEDVFITVGSVTLLSTLLGFIICKYEKQIDNYTYKIKPIFGKNILLFNGDLSISFKTRRIGIFLNPKEHTKFKLLVGG